MAYLSGTRTTTAGTCAVRYLLDDPNKKALFRVKTPYVSGSEAEVEIGLSLQGAHCESGHYTLRVWESLEEVARGSLVRPMWRAVMLSHACRPSWPACRSLIPL